MFPSLVQPPGYQFLRDCVKKESTIRKPCWGLAMRFSPFSLCFSLILMLAAGCTTYKQQPVPFKMPSAYQNAIQVAGATVAAKAFAEAKEAKEAFGFDIRGAGLYPVQIIFDNTGGNTFYIESSQTFLVDGEDNLWSIMDSALAYDRIAEKTEMSRIGRGAAKPGFLGAAGGGLLGAAIGIVSGHNVLDAAAKGAALGGAVGATAGGAASATSGENARYEISRDLRAKSLENKGISPQSIAHGFIFFPGEAKGTGELRLQLRVKETSEIHMIRLVL